jgi:hypothetical protein
MVSDADATGRDRDAEPGPAGGRRPAVQPVLFDGPLLALADMPADGLLSAAGPHGSAAGARAWLDALARITPLGYGATTRHGTWMAPRWCRPALTVPSGGQDRPLTQAARGRRAPARGLAGRGLLPTSASRIRDPLPGSIRRSTATTPSSTTLLHQPPSAPGAAGDMVDTAREVGGWDEFGSPLAAHARDGSRQLRAVELV